MDPVVNIVGTAMSGAGASSPRTPITKDAWKIVAKFLEIDDLAKLLSTCHHTVHVALRDRLWTVLLARGILPEYDPFRLLIDNATTDLMEREQFRQRLCGLRFTEHEPWTHCRPGIVMERHAKIQGALAFGSHKFIDNTRRYETSRNSIVIYDQIHTAHIRCVSKLPALEAEINVMTLSNDGMITVIYDGESKHYFFRPDVDALRTTPNYTPRVIQRASRRCFRLSRTALVAAVIVATGILFQSTRT